MEFPVQCQELLDIAGVAHLIGELAKVVDVGRVQMGHAVAQQKWLDPFAHLVQLGALVHAQAGDPRACVGHRGDEPFGLQDP